jgi:CBS domain-containing protein
MAIERLRGHEVFSLLSPKEIEQLAEASGVMHLKQGERVYSDGLPATHLFVLVTGRVELTRPVKGKAGFLVDDIVQGGMFGVSPLAGLQRYILDATCVEDSDVLKIEVARLRAILEENLVAGFAIQQKVAQIFFKR